VKKTTVIAALISLAFSYQATADVDLIRINFDSEQCPQSVSNDEDSCPQSVAGLACRKPGQRIIWQAAQGPNRPQFTIQPKGITNGITNVIVGCSLTSTPGAVLNCRISDSATVGKSYDYGVVANTECPLDPRILIVR